MSATLLILAAAAPQAAFQERVERHLKDLASPNAAVRERAELDLTLGGDDYAEAIEAAMKSGDADFQARCAEVLRQIGLARRGRFAWAPARPANLPSAASTLKEAAARLTKTYGYAILLGELDPRTRVNFKVEFGSFLQALEALCRSCGIWYRWRDACVELVKEKPPELPRLHVGPFAMAASVATLEDEPGLFLRFDTDWERKVAPEWFEVKVESITDDKNAAVLLARRKENGHLGEATLTKKFSVRTMEEYREEWTRDEFLLGPTSSGKLGTVKGKVTFWFPLEVVKVRFENPKPRDVAEAGPFTARLNFYDFYKDHKAWDVQMELQLADTPRETALPLWAMLTTKSIRFIDAAGVAHDSGTKGGQGNGGTAANMLQRINISRGTDKLTLENPPKALECDVAVSVWTRSFPFEFKGVRIPKAKK